MVYSGLGAQEYDAKTNNWTAGGTDVLFHDVPLPALVVVTMKQGARATAEKLQGSSFATKVHVPRR